VQFQIRESGHSHGEILRSNVRPVTLYLPSGAMLCQLDNPRFYLGKQESYLWAVTRSSIELHRLPAESEVREDVRRFRQAIISAGSSSDASTTGGQTAGARLGADLYQRLFGALDPADAAKSSWLLSLDGTLFELPFAALVNGYRNGRPVYLAERHSSQRIPGAFFLNGPFSSGTAPLGGYLGVADPVYNSADPRWKPGSRLSITPQNPEQLNRLVSSARELRRSSENWQADTRAARPIQILEGTAAQRGAFLEGLNTSTVHPAPATIHLATHVLTPATPSEQAFLAFSLDAGGRPGLLSTSEIGMLHVPGALVVMTGCATGTGEARAGAGLLGLTRAWMMAGARAVVATNWPVPDADGDLIPAFYRHLGAHSAAEALRLSQVELIRTSSTNGPGAWQASPSYWAAFQVTGGGR
jgi:CHAT domain-containing protein